MSVIEQPGAGFRPGTGTRAQATDAWVSRYVRLAITVDFCCALAAGLAGLEFRFGDDARAPRPDALLAMGLPLLWVGWLALARAYDARFFGIGSDEYRRVVNAGVSLTAAVAIASYTTKAEVARGYVVIVLPLVTLLTLAGRYHLRKYLHRRRAKGQCLRRVVAVGHRAAVTELVREFGRAPYHGMQVVAACLPVSGGDEDILGTVPVEGHLAEVAEVVERTGAHTVAVLACPELAGVELRRLAWRLEKKDTELLVASALLDIAGPRTTIRPVAGLPLLHVDHPELAGVRRMLKGAFDRAVAAAALVLLSPLWGLVALLIRADDPGPAFYAQWRIGRNGRRFRMLKFRTMVVDADRRRAELSPAARNGLLFKLRDDPRITRLGARLRRFSVDELPQLVNVLRGEMSLVGPRPPLPDEVERYGEDVYRRLAVKPGMTGLWQISGRSDLPWDEAVRLDVRYIENWSLTLDTQILWKTFAVVVRGQGAY